MLACRPSAARASHIHIQADALRLRRPSPAPRPRAQRLDVRGRWDGSLKMALARAHQLSLSVDLDAMSSILSDDSCDSAPTSPARSEAGAEPDAVDDGEPSTSSASFRCETACGSPFTSFARGFAACASCRAASAPARSRPSADPCGRRLHARRRRRHFGVDVRVSRFRRNKPYKIKMLALIDLPPVEVRRCRAPLALARRCRPRPAWSRACTRRRSCRRHASRPCWQLARRAIHGSCAISWYRPLLRFANDATSRPPAPEATAHHEVRLLLRGPQAFRCFTVPDTSNAFRSIESLKKYELQSSEKGGAIHHVYLEHQSKVGLLWFKRAFTIACALATTRVTPQLVLLCTRWVPPPHA